MKAVIIARTAALRPEGRLVENPEFIRFGAHWGFRMSGLPPLRAQDRAR